MYLVSGIAFFYLNAVLWKVLFHEFGSLFGASGLHFGGLGRPWAPFWALGAPKQILDVYFSHFFPTFGALWPPSGALERPREPKSAQNDAKSHPESSPK